jgi:hypothetical protein
MEKRSFLKQLNQLDNKVGGSLDGLLSTEFVYLPNESKLGRKHPWKVIYKDWAFSFHLLINMATTGHSCF